MNGRFSKMRRCFAFVRRMFQVIKLREHPTNKDRALQNTQTLSLVVRNADIYEAENAVSASRMQLRELHVVDTLVSLEFFNRIAACEGLQTLEIRNIRGIANLDFLWSLGNMKRLVLDDTRLTDGDVSPIFSLEKLENLTLGLRDASSLTRYLWAGCSARVNLILHGSRRGEISQFLESIPNLVELSFRDFGSMRFPYWLRSFDKLEGLSFENGYLSCEKNKARRLFCPSLTRFSSCNCSIDATTLKRILYSGRSLTSLELSLDCISKGLKLQKCAELRVLKLYGKEFDSETLLRISQLPHLRELHIGGCLALKSHHIACLHELQSLEKISLASSFVMPDAWPELASLETVKHLEFNACFGVDLYALAGMHSCVSIQLINCLRLESQLTHFLEAPTTQSLDVLNVHCELGP